MRTAHRALVRAAKRFEAAQNGAQASRDQVRIGVLQYNSGRTTAFELVRSGRRSGVGAAAIFAALVRTAKAESALRFLTSSGYSAEATPSEGAEAMTRIPFWAGARTGALAALFLLAVRGLRRRRGPAAGSRCRRCRLRPRSRPASRSSTLRGRRKHRGRRGDHRGLGDRRRGGEPAVPRGAAGDAGNAPGAARRRAAQGRGGAARGAAGPGPGHVRAREAGGRSEARARPRISTTRARTLKVAEANLALAQTRLSKARIVAPFDGMVGSQARQPGRVLASRGARSPSSPRSSS